MYDRTELLHRRFTVAYEHRIYFTRTVFDAANSTLADVLQLDARPAPPRVLVMIDIGVAIAFPKLSGQIEAYFAERKSAAHLVAPPRIAPGGEAVKNSRALVDELYSEIERHRLCRHSYVLAIGGGALLDAAGFAAATAHRGVRLIRLPTTTLSQADGGVGVKNGINLFAKKNFVGTFAPPFAVINDADFLAPLPAAEKRAGLIEALKVALIRDAAFFAEMERDADALVRFEPTAVERIVRRCAELHVEHIAGSGDPFESGSARPLDFGHWSAHKLEQLSGFAVAHGEAVACGLALDTLYSAACGMLAREDAERVLRLIQRLGFALFHPLMRPNGPGETWPLLAGLEEFREHLGGELTITLLRAIGRGEEVHEIDPVRLRQCAQDLERWPG
jgi:3-dehydroquinate synthase